MCQKIFRVITLGCRTNQYESQAYRDQLEQMGFIEAKEGQKTLIFQVKLSVVA